MRLWVWLPCLYNKKVFQKRKLYCRNCVLSFRAASNRNIIPSSKKKRAANVTKMDPQQLHPVCTRTRAVSKTFGSTTLLASGSNEVRHVYLRHVHWMISLTIFFIHARSCFAHTYIDFPVLLSTACFVNAAPTRFPTCTCLHTFLVTSPPCSHALDGQCDRIF